jgi:hypothetical protein
MHAHLTANLLFAALIMKPTRGRALSAGLVGSLALVLHNPVPHALFAAPWIFAMAVERDQRRYLLPLILGYLPGLALGMGWLVFRMDIASAVQGAFTGHGIAAGIFRWPNAALLNMRTAALVKMWLWTLPCLFVFAVMGGLRQRDNRCVRLLAQSAILTFVGFLFVRFDQGHGWGYRYFHSAWAAVPILAGCAMTARPDDRQDVKPSLVTFAGASAILNLIIVMPFQMHQIGEIISEHLAQLPIAKRPGDNVYFLHPRGGFYVADMVQIDPLLRDTDLFLVSHGSELDERLIRQNWPGAALIARTLAADQWYLGPQDQRVPISGEKTQKHFVLTSAESATLPSAADR